MNKFENQTYQELLNLVNNSESFHFKDFNLKGSVYRIFNYHLASWTSFLEPSALNCRGIMFDVTDENNIKLVSLPPEKFFNYEEGGVDHTIGRLGDKMDKMDGSLISTYVHDGELYLKSKGSLFSSQATDSMNFLNKEENQQFKQEMTDLVKNGYTVNLEYTSPNNRIVIPYQKEDLTVLSVRSHEDGENYFASKLKNFLEKNGYMKMIDHLVRYEDLRNHALAHHEFVDNVRNEQEGEGYVVEIVVSDKESYLVKVKNLKYIALHQTKDSVNSPRRLFEAIINEASDDLRSMFADDPFILGEITKMEDHVQPIYNNIIKTVESFYEENKDLVRKDFAIKAQKEQPKFTGLIMNLYVNEKTLAGEITPRPSKDGKPFTPKNNDYKEFAIKNRKELFGIGDEEMELDDDGNIIKKKSPTITM